MPSSIPSLGSIEACLSCHILSPTTCSLGRTAEQRHRDNVKEYSVSHILRISSRIYGKERNSIMLQIERNYTICQGRSQWGINLVTCTSETRVIHRKWLPGLLLLQTMFLFYPKAGQQYWGRGLLGFYSEVLNIDCCSHFRNLYAKFFC